MTQTPKACSMCGSTATGKWYSGPTCRKCYKKKWYDQNKDREKRNMSDYYKKKR